MPQTPIAESPFLRDTELGLGTWAWGDRLFWQYGHGYTDEDIAEAFRISVANGINFIDTAEVYGTGRSERLIGQLIRDSQAPVIIATKYFPFPNRMTKNSVVRALRRSLERLGLERVDLYQLHWASPVVPIKTHVEGLALAVKAGLTRHVGVSNYNRRQTRQAYSILKDYGIELASNQVEYHLLDRKVEQSGLLEQCSEMGVRLIAYSPLAMGMLTGKYTPENPPPGLRGRKYGAILEELPSLIALMKEIGNGHGEKSPAQVALNWVICKGALPIPGAKTAAQAKQNAGAVGWKLTKEEVAALDSASDKIN